ncbi:hypothetical protein [Rhodococcus sp. HNM0569]|uniref:hypothetical protein n=1 Tax=Rhodococcus sp. HNM0569 TaxID=2716340 RepID=UPI00146CA8CD|nr:hypothetical protein [Rhodococcus sp. HNM0569]NLU81347.1 hypothetical protein [Rhodococcus sp. HNM0569]
MGSEGRCSDSSSAFVDERAKQLVAASLNGDVAQLSTASEWMDALSAKDLVRFDRRVRRGWITYGQRLQMERCWSASVLAAHPAVAIAASTFAHGYVRERAVNVLAWQEGPQAARALALRAYDPVHPIAYAASAAVLARVDLGRMQVIAPILFTMRRWQPRWRSDVFDDYVAEAEKVHGVSSVWSHLMTNDDVHLRRYAYRRAADLGVLDVERAVADYPVERDVVVQQTLGKVVLQQGDPRVAARLLIRGHSVADRAAALAHLAADAFAFSDLRRVLVDRSSLVRLWARRRWTELDEDPVTTYREIVVESAQPARARARAYLGLTECGHPPDAATCRSLTLDRASPLRSTGLRLLSGRAEPSDPPWLLGLVAAGSRGESRWARVVLGEQPYLWSVSDAESIWASPEPEVRRRAWMLCRARGGWDSVVADLRACGDTDAMLHGAGRAVRAAIPQYKEPTEAQRAQVACLLPSTGLSDVLQREIAARAGLA